jgi:hydrogenase/urease accessory protein HupE
LFNASQYFFASSFQERPMHTKTNQIFKLIAICFASCSANLAFAHAGHGEPHGLGAHASDFMSYVIGFIAALAFVNFGGMGVAQYIKGNLSQARALGLGSLCTACVLVFIYWFTQV